MEDEEADGPRQAIGLGYDVSAWIVPDSRVPLPVRASLSVSKSAHSFACPMLLNVPPMSGESPTF